MEAILADSEQAPTEPLRATLALLRALMRAPEHFGPAQLERARAAGLERSAIEDAIAVGSTFACITRVADGLGFPAPNARSRTMATKRLLGGYGAPPVERSGARRYAAAWDRLVRAVLTTPGHAEPALREQVFAWVERDARSADVALDELPAALHVLVRKGSRNAHTIGDEDIAALLAAGWHERAVFELILALACAAGSTRYAIAMDALDRASG